jgi:hypothetical protein
MHYEKKPLDQRQHAQLKTISRPIVVIVIKLKSRIEFTHQRQTKSLLGAKEKVIRVFQPDISFVEGKKL